MAQAYLEEIHSEMVVRFLYNRSGEIFTVLVCLGIGFYLIVSLSGSGEILDNENAAYEKVKEIYRLEKEALHIEKLGRYIPLSQIKHLSPMLKSLEKIPLQKEDNVELFNDEKYLYFFQLEYRPHGAEDYIINQGENEPTTFMLLAWPVVFSTTGEIAFYVDGNGTLALSANKRAPFDGLKGFPPDLKSVAEALREGGKDTESSGWRVERLQ